MACLVLRAYRDLTYRGTADLLDASDAPQLALGLGRVPAHTTLKLFCDRAVTPALLDALVRQVLAMLVEAGLAVAEVAVDSAGLETTGASTHFRSRAARARSGYVKLSVAVACASIVLVSMALGMGPTNDLSDARDALSPAAARCRPDRVPADKGYDAEWSHTFCRAWGAASHVPPVAKAKDGSIKSGPDRVRCGRREPYHYGRRWHVETFFSGMKRTCGSTLAARSEPALLAEAGSRGPRPSGGSGTGRCGRTRRRTPPRARRRPCSPRR
jgi:transposase